MNGPRFPVQYELVTADISWATVTEFGTLTLSPPNVAGIFLLDISATDAIGVTIQFTVKIAVA